MCPGYHAELSAGPVWERLRRELGIEGDEREGDGRRGLERVSRTRTTGQWEERASERDLLPVAVRYVEQDDTAREQGASTRGDNET
jgi:hypothetical protein